MNFGKLLFVIIFVAWLFVAVLIASLAHADDHFTRPARPVWLDVTADQICASGYSHAARPPVRMTDGLKRLWVGQHNDPADFELDHNGPICLGGAPRDARNLWLQSWPEARRKDLVEAKACREVCAHRITLLQGRKMVENWK